MTVTRVGVRGVPRVGRGAGQRTEEQGHVGGVDIGADLPGSDALCGEHAERQVERALLSGVRLAPC